MHHGLLDDILGDLNVSPWSPHFGGLLRESGRGVQATWPTNLAPMRIPIDHCLVSPDVSVVGRRVGPDVGSDHFPIVVDVQIGSR